MRRRGTAKSYTGGVSIPERRRRFDEKNNLQAPEGMVGWLAPGLAKGRGCLPWRWQLPPLFPDGVRHRPVDKGKRAIFFPYAKTMFKTMQAATIMIASVSGRLCQASACEEGILVRL